MRFVDGNDCGRDGGDDVSAKKQPGEVPGVVVFNEEREREREKLFEPGDRESQRSRWGFERRQRPRDRMKE